MFRNCHGRPISFNLLALVDDCDVYSRIAALVVQNGGAVTAEARATLHTQTVFLDLREPGSERDHGSRTTARANAAEEATSSPVESSGDVLSSAEIKQERSSTRDDQNRIKEADDLKPDTYHYSYVERCVLAGFLVDPRPYRVQSRSVFTRDIAILRVILDTWSWADLWMRGLSSSPLVDANDDDDSERLYLSSDSRSSVIEEQCFRSPMLSRAASAVSSYADAVSSPPAATASFTAADPTDGDCDVPHGSEQSGDRGDVVPLAAASCVDAGEGIEQSGDRGDVVPLAAVSCVDAGEGIEQSGDRDGVVCLAAASCVEAGEGVEQSGNRDDVVPSAAASCVEAGEGVEQSGNRDDVVPPAAASCVEAGEGVVADGVRHGVDSDDSDDMLARAGVSLTEVGSGIGSAYSRQRFCAADDWRLLHFVADTTLKHRRRFTLPYLVTGRRYWREVHAELPDQLRRHSPLSLWTRFLRDLVPRLPTLRQQGDARVVDTVCELIGTDENHPGRDSIRSENANVNDTAGDSVAVAADTESSQAMSMTCSDSGSQRGQCAREQVGERTDPGAVMPGSQPDISVATDHNDDDDDADELEQLKTYINSMHPPTPSKSPAERSTLVCSNLLLVDVSESHHPVVSSSNDSVASMDLTLVGPGSSEIVDAQTTSASCLSLSEPNDTQVGSTMNDAVLEADLESTISSLEGIAGSGIDTGSTSQSCHPRLRRHRPRRLYTGRADSELLSQTAATPSSSRVKSHNTSLGQNVRSSTGSMVTRFRPYSPSDDDRILDFFQQCPRRVLEARGRAVWEELERHMQGERTWQSLKNRFLRSIVPRIYSYQGRERNFLEQIANALQKYMK